VQNTWIKINKDAYEVNIEIVANGFLGTKILVK